MKKKQDTKKPTNRKSLGMLAKEDGRISPGKAIEMCLGLLGEIHAGAPRDWRVDGIVRLLLGIQKTVPGKVVQSAVPPDPEELNDKRAGWVAKSLLLFQQETGTDHDDAVCHFIANLGHYCDRHGLHLFTEIKRAENHYDAETDGQGKQFGLTK